MTWAIIRQQLSALVRCDDCHDRSQRCALYRV